MTAAAHYFPNYQLVMAEKLAGNASNTQAVQLNTADSGTIDTLKVGLVASGTYTWGATPQGQTTVANFLAGDGTDGALTEVTGGSYARQSLTGVTYTKSGEVVTLNCTSPITWTATANYSAVYAFFYDYTAGAASDSTGLMICYWDFGGTVSVVSGGNFTLTISGSGLVTWTAS